MFVCLRVGSVQGMNFLAESLHESLLHILVDENVVRRDTGLAAVECLAPGNPACCKGNVRMSVNDARTLSAELQHDRGKVLCS